jgi:hypothetical protein
MAWDVAVARDGLLDNMSTQDDPALLDGGEGEEAEGEDKSNCQYLLIGERRADSVRTPGQYRTAGRSIHRLGVRSVGVSFA